VEIKRYDENVFKLMRKFCGNAVLDNIENKKVICASTDKGQFQVRDFECSIEKCPAIKYYNQHLLEPREDGLDENGLLPCPFCGGAPRWLSDNIETDEIKLICCGNAQQCDNYASKDFAIKAWNTRAVEPREDKIDNCPVCKMQEAIKNQGKPVTPN